MGCYKIGDFKKYFNENMNDLGLPVPEKLFDTMNAAIANAGLMVETLGTLGANATIGELIGAATGLEKIKVVASLGASYYVGAIIGSIAVATGRSLSCGSRISDLFVFLQQNDLQFDNWNHFYARHPEILDKNHPFRKNYYNVALGRSRLYA